ncbi:MAG: DUF3298 domain-containing protein [Oscillibacter sp.]|nr:DUF3298 domain-containing protein [Oscillibacter sp.]
MKHHLTQLHIESFTAEREWTVDEIPVLSAALSLPRPVDEGRVAGRIRRYYQLQGRAFLRYCESFLLPAAAAEYRLALEASRPLPHFHAELGYYITYNKDGFFSLYTQSREPAPGAPPLLQRRGDTWDLTAGYPVPLQSFFPRGSRWRQRLWDTAAAEIRRQEAAGVARYHEGWQRLLRRRFDPDHYYLTENGLSFFYSMYALGPAAEGIPVFSLPCGDLFSGLSGQKKTPAP